MRIVGVDLVWGDRKPDGLALIEATFDGRATLQRAAYVFGDEALVSWVREFAGAGPALLALDGPIICSEVLGDLETGFIVVPKSSGVVGDAWTTS